MQTSLLSPDIFLSDERIARLEEPCSQEAFEWLDAHGRLGNEKTFLENWTEVMRESPAKEPLFIAVGPVVKQGKFKNIANACSHTMAKRIARSLNSHKTNERGY